MQLQSLKLLRPMVYEKIQLHETTRTNIRAHAWTDGRTNSDEPTLVRNQCTLFSTRKSGYKMSILRKHLQYLNGQ